MAFNKLLSFTKDVSDLPDKPSLTPTELKTQFDAAPNEVRVYFNSLIDALKLTTAGDSGAKNIGASTISGLTGSDVQSLVESLKSYTDSNFALKSVVDALPKIQKGSVSMTLTNNDFTSKNLTFPTAFTSAPNVVAMVTGQTTYFCSVSDITTTGCTLYARREETLSGSETFTVLWIAIA